MKILKRIWGALKWLNRKINIPYEERQKHFEQFQPNLERDLKPPMGHSEYDSEQLGGLY